MAKALRAARLVGVVLGAAAGGALFVFFMWFLIRMNF